MDKRFGTTKPAAARRLGGHPGSLAEETQERGLVQAEVEVATFEAEDRLIRPEKATLRESFNCDRAPLQLAEHVFQAGQDCPLIARGQPLGHHLDPHAFIEALRLQHLFGAQEVHVGHGPGPDLVV